MTQGPPDAEAQLRFLRQLQRLLEEGSFVATYKFALLHSIADLCVMSGDESGGPLELSTSEIAERFIHLYWRQTVPFLSGPEAAVLMQNTGRQAAVVREVQQRHEGWREGTIIDNVKQADGSRSWRNNNPGNIEWTWATHW